MVGQRHIEPHKITLLNFIIGRFGWLLVRLFGGCDTLPNLGAACSSHAGGTSKINYLTAANARLFFVL